MSLAIADGPGLDPVEEEAERAPAERVLTGADLCPKHGFVLLGCPGCVSVIARSAAGAPAERVTGCSCFACDGSPAIRSRYYLCSICGNKRCPHATDHRLTCTGSNEPGQKGSAYE